jgi:phospholipase/lecithinase/hemolysin
MNSIFSRTLKALCTFAVVGLLYACGSSSTVDPFKPTRVVGLGDGYNDIRTAAGGAAPTVRTGAGTSSSVVERVAAYFGQSNVVSYATGGARMADLAAQINSVGSFSSGDLVVIAVGTFDVKANATPATEAQTLVTQVQRLKTAGVTHILIMPVLDVSRTPWGRANSFDTTATNTFNTALLTALNAAFGGNSPNSVIFANASGVTSLFLTATSVTTYSPFTDTGYNGTAAGTVPACGNPAPLLGDTSIPVGCDASAANASYATMLFADGIHLTPAGNNWVAQYLFNATAQGWR